ncbi:hypothetical protein [Marinobacter goseongensis]|uniref:hypothetical protein n=1 Tax=Marinobacter goseongensis TaxID=453838 RepID=UPI0020060DEF|nr:hypothetical protein [Marinobacter goseongensis]MCK7553151.1 hypothetical protein [Marinobacter goseongensis]
MDGKSLVYAPKWFKLASIGVMLLSFMVCVYVILFYIGIEQKEDWILLALALAQTSMAGALFVLFVMFSSREANIKVLKSKNKNFLDEILVSALKDSFVSSGKNEEELSVQIVDRQKSWYSKLYKISLKDSLAIEFAAFLNIKRFQAFFYLPADKFENEDQVYESLKYELERPRALGYQFDIYLKFEERFNMNCWTVGIHKELVDDFEFLEIPTLKLYWASDIAMMISSFLLLKRRTNIPLL